MGLLNKIKKVADRKYYGNRTFPEVTLKKPSKKVIMQKRKVLRRDLWNLHKVLS